MRRMLIVEDEQDICDCLGQFFSARGFSVTLAFSGEDALKQFEENPADVILIDILLPGLSGLEVLKRIKAARPRVQAVMVTSVDQESTRVEAQHYGAAAYVTKPFDFSPSTWSSVLVPA